MGEKLTNFFFNYRQKKKYLFKDFSNVYKFYSSEIVPSQILILTS